MPQTPHIERHFTASEVVRDVVIGMSDGLTVPFALAAGLTGAAAITTHIIVTAGLAEIAAGSIAMGLGGYLAAKSDAEHYVKEREREKREVAEIPHEEMREVAEVFQSYGLSEAETAPIVQALRQQPQKWIDFMMRFELGLEKPNPKRAMTSAFTIGGAYAAGGFRPAGTLHRHRSRLGGAALFGCRNGGGSLCFRFYQGPLHWNETSAQRTTNGFYRKRRGRRCVCDREIDIGSKGQWSVVSGQLAFA